MADKKSKAFQDIVAIKLLKKGEKGDNFTAVQSFLERFGYLADKADCSPGELDNPTSEALSKYQKCHGLAASGEFDSPTRTQMSTHRCAFPDMRLGVEFATTCAWDKQTLTYAFDTGTNDVSGNEEFDACRSAFGTWASVVDLTFSEVGAGENPDILIGWRPADDPDLDMQGGTLAHADFPPACSVVTNSLPKPVHFDDTEHTWSIGALTDAFDVETVALHEIGHILGLAHSNVAGSIMFPSVSANAVKRDLTQDDIAGIQNLYPATQPPPIDPGNDGGRCFIASAAYGSDIAPEVNFLRGIRDEVLRKMDWGRDWFKHFENFYYSISPQIAARMHQDPELKNLIGWSIVEPWTHYLKLMVSRPNWNTIDFDTLDPQLRDFLLSMKQNMDHWLKNIELPQNFDGKKTEETVNELNVILNYILRGNGLEYLDRLVEQGILPLPYDQNEKKGLLDILKKAGRSKEEIDRILDTQRTC